MKLQTMILMCCLALSSGTSLRAQMDPDAEGCTDSPLVNRFPHSRIDSCENKDYDQGDFPLPAAKDGTSQSKHVEGEYHELIYMTQPGVSAIQLFRNFQNALQAAQFKIDYTSSPDEMVGHKGGTWIYLTYRDDSYEQKIIIQKELEQEIRVDAAGLGNEIEKTGQVAVYGIHFDTGKATLKPDSDAVLGEILKMLQQNTSLNLNIEGHTDSQGAAASNQVLSQKRAESVVAWLMGHGIAASRLTAVGKGQTVPIGDNSTEEGRAQNRRVELVKR